MAVGKLQTETVSALFRLPETAWICNLTLTLNQFVCEFADLAVLAQILKQHKSQQNQIDENQVIFGHGGSPKSEKFRLPEIGAMPFLAARCIAQSLDWLQKSSVGTWGD